MSGIGKMPTTLCSLWLWIERFFSTDHRQLTTDTISLDIGGYYGIYGNFGMV